MLSKLARVANKLDSVGLVKEADVIDRFILKLAQQGSVPSNRVWAAIQKSIGMPHFDNAFKTRNPSPESEGSTFLEPQTPETLMMASWEPANDSSIKAPAVGFVADIPGYFGVVDLAGLDRETPVTMVKAHKGAVNEAVCLISGSDAERPRADFTTILLGPDDDGEIVWTFFPGPAISPSSFPWDESLTESVKTVSDAIDIGFRYGKLSGG